MSIDTAALRHGLETERTELANAIADTERALDQTENETVRANLELQQSQLRKVDHALDRHREGLWDTCEDCGGLIAESQIRAVPTATHCTDCAEDHVFWGDTQVFDVEDLTP